MSNPQIILGVILALSLFSLGPFIPSFAQTPVANPNANVTTTSQPELTLFYADKTSYSSGDKIYFSGTVQNNYSPNVTILINDPNNKFVLLASGVADSNHHFQVVIDTNTPDVIMKLSQQGTYTATAFVTNEANGIETSFVFSPMDRTAVCNTMGGSHVSLDKQVYDQNDVISITVTVGGCNTDPNALDVIGDGSRGTVSITSRSAKLDHYQLIETGPNTGVFTGKVILNGDGQTSTSAKGPTDGTLSVFDHDGIVISFTRTGWGGTVTANAIVSSTYYQAHPTSPTLPTPPTTPPTTPNPTPIPTPPPSPANTTSISSTPSKIPNWVKGIFNFYAQGNLSDDDLIKALQFLVQQGIIKLH